MMKPTDPLAHLPDPSKRYQVLAVTRGAEVFVELRDDATNVGVVMDAMSALRVAADITLEMARIFELMGEQLEDGTIPIWQGNVLEKPRHGEGTAELN